MIDLVDGHLLELFVAETRDYAIFLLDADGYVATWNAGAERINGYAEPEIVGRHFSVFHSPKDVASGLPERELQTALSVGRFEDEGWRLRQNGTRFWASVVITALRDSEGTLLGFGKVTRDLTERRDRELTAGYERFKRMVQDAREQFRRSFEDAPIGMVIVDLEGRLVEVNDALGIMIGYGREALVGQPCRAITHPEEVEQAETTIARLLTGDGRTVTRESRFVHADGHTVWATVSTTLIRDADGQPHHFIAQVQDITARREDVTARRAAEERLRERERQFATAQTLAQVGSYVWDVSQPTLEFSDELCRIFGQPLGFSPTYDAVFELVHPDDRQALKRRADGAIELGERGEEIDEYRIIRPDGAVRMVQGRRYARTQPDGQVTHLVGTVQDITERHANEERLRTDAREQEALHALATLVAKETAPATVFADAARRAAEILGADFCGVARLEPSGEARLVGSWSVADLPELPTGSLLHLDAPSAVALALSSGLITDLARDDGPLDNGVRSIRSALAAPIAVNGRRWGAITIGWGHENGAGPDGEERIARMADLLSLAVTAAEARKQQARDTQASRLESLGQLAGGVAHDFNNLLAVILGYAQFAADALPEHSTVRADIQEILNAADRASVLTQQLLTFGRHQTPEHEPVALNDVIRDHERMLRRTLGEHIRVDTDLDPDLAMIVTNRGQLGQLLINLAVNARDAMPNGGRLTITTSNEIPINGLAPQASEVSAGPAVRLQVTDSGVGMPTSVRERAFEPFFTTKPPGQGTGLGLASVHGIVTQSHGTITLSSEPGRGTTCTILFPASPIQAEPTEPPPTAAPCSSGAGRRILVVDDQDALRRAATRTLSAAGYEVHETASPLKALDLLSGQHFDLLLSDVVMPEMMGTELGARARSLDSRLRVLYVSGYQDLRAESGEHTDRREPILTKPFTRDQLLTATAAALGQPVDRA